MRALTVAALVLLQSGAPGGSGGAEDGAAQHLRVERAVRLAAGTRGQTCAVLDANVYAHAGSESLNDLRLFADGTEAETPFTLTESNTAGAETERAAVRNLGTEKAAQGESIVFDLEMPRRPYTAVDLALNAKNFVGTATVWGRGERGREVALGEFAIFDLSGQHLSRTTTLPLQESSFAELHVRLELRAAPGTVPNAAAGTSRHLFDSRIVTGASVPPSRAAQTLYTTVAETAAWTQHGHNSVATLHLPSHAPVARVEFAVNPEYKANFLRDVTVSARPDHQEEADSPISDVDAVSGEISQVHLPSGTDGMDSAGVAIDNRQMDVEAVLAANLRGGATVEVTVANGNDSPLPLGAVQLQMRQRRICFEANATGYRLFYGDKELAAPVYDYSRLFVPSEAPAQATLDPEQPNPRYVQRADARPFTERHPELLWLALFTALAALGGVALRGVRHQRGASH